VLGSAVRLVIVGAGLGLGAAVALSRWAQSQFYGVSATDPAVYGGVAIVVMLTAIGATWAPARQAQRVDPARTLRSD
jgi:putative ABC transport system permease protein